MNVGAVCGLVRVPVMSKEWAYSKYIMKFGEEQALQPGHKFKYWSFCFDISEEQYHDLVDAAEESEYVVSFQETTYSLFFLQKIDLGWVSLILVAGRNTSKTCWQTATPVK